MLLWIELKKISVLLSRTLGVNMKVDDIDIRIKKLRRRMFIADTVAVVLMVFNVVMIAFLIGWL